MTPIDPTTSWLARGLAAAALLLIAACGDNLGPPARDDAGPTIDAAVAIDASVDAPPAALGPCLDRPTDPPRPPAGQLPCELIRPGFQP